MDRYAVTRTGDAIIVDVGTLIRQTDDEAAWDAAYVPLV